MPTYPPISSFNIFTTFNAGLGTGGANSWSGGNLFATGTIDSQSGFKVVEGANAKQGISAAMVAGSVTVANTSVTANSKILVTRAPGGTNPGAVYVSAIVAGTSFTITSTNAADTGQVFYEIFEPG